MANKILMFAGSARKDSVNKKLILAAEAIAKTQGAEVTNIDLKDYPLPIYDGDIEEENGCPENAKKICKLISEHDYMLISSPEYNGLPSPLLKNVIDWVSRVDVKVYDGKIAAIISASPGGLGGFRGLNHLRTLLTNLNVITTPKQIALGGAFTAFAEDGSLNDSNNHDMLSDVISSLLKVKR